MEKITIDFMMIIGKYFEKPIDYINVMKVNKKFEHLTLMYKFNPIGDTSLFPNIQTQNFYRKVDFLNVIPKMFRYVYWGTFNSKLESAVKKVNPRNYIVNEYDNKSSISEKLISKNIDHKHIMSLLYGLPFQCNELVYDSTVPSLSESVPKLTGMVIQIFYDDDNNSVALLRGCNGNTVYNKMIPSLNRVSYYDFITKIKVFSQENGNFTIESNSDEVLISFITNTQLSFSFTIEANKKCTMKIVNKGLNKSELESLIFPNNVVSRSNPSLIKFNVKRCAMYTLTTSINDDYYTHLLQQGFGRSFNVLLDTWINPQYVNYNLGYVRYIDCDAFGNYIMFNVFPTQVIITRSINGIVTNIKPLCDMSSLIINIESENVYARYDFYKRVFEKYYNLTWSDVIYPLKVFYPVRRLVCTNQLTRCSCVHEKSYRMKVRAGKFVNY